MKRQSKSVNIYIYWTGESLHLRYTTKYFCYQRMQCPAQSKIHQFILCPWTYIFHHACAMNCAILAHIVH